MKGTEAAEVQAASKLVELAIEQGWFEKLLNALRKKPRVLVLGSTGVGKTNFLNSLTEMIPKAINNVNRTEFVTQRGIKIARQPFVFIDTPGQQLHASRRRRAFLDAMSKGVSGVINVVSYGYHEYNIGKASAITKTGRARQSFLKEHRQIEIDALHEWTSLLGDREISGWLITVVSKADLWWNQREEVMAYYRSGPYSEALGEAKNLEPTVLGYCSVFHKFFGEAPLSGYFDEADRVQMRSNLLETLLNSIGRREGNG